MPPRFSIITPAFNSAGSIERTIDSVLAQTLTDFEYLIVDGGSTDGTCELVRRHTDPRVRLISERDQGIYDAMNKGIASTRGALVGILNSDDAYSDANVLSDVDHCFQRSGADAVYGDIEYVNGAGKVVRRWKSGPYDARRWYRGWHPPHPALFITRSAYGVAGPYDIGLKLSADVKLMVAMALKHQMRFGHVDRVLVQMATGGVSTRGLGPIVRSNLEVLQAWRDLGLKPPKLLVLGKLLYKLQGKLARK